MAARVCPICNRQFSKAEHLKRHERSHTRAKPYKCHICGKCFGRSDVLLRHCKKHEQDAQDALKAQTDSSTVEAAAVRSTSQMSTTGSNTDSLTHSDWSLQLNDYDHDSTSTRSSISSVRSTVAAAGLMPQNNSQIDSMAVDGEFWNGEALAGTTMTINPIHATSNSISSELVMGALGPSSVASACAATAASQKSQQPAFMEHDELTAPVPTHDTNTPGNQNNPPMPQLEPIDQMPDFDSFAMGVDLYTQRNQVGLSDLSLFDFDRPWWLSPGREQVTVTAEPITSNESQHRLNQPREPPGAVVENAVDAQQRTRLNPVSEEHWPRLERFWSRSADKSTRLMSTLWDDLLAGHGLFCGVPEQGQGRATNAGELTSVWSLDIKTRQRVHSAFCALLDPVDIGSGQLVIPGPDMFDLAFEQYVYQHHKTMPIFHLPTFRAEYAPTSLLVVACTIGLSIIGNADLIRLVCKIFPKVLELASSELHACTTKTSTLEKRLGALITATLSLSLSSLMSHQVRIEQSESLCISLLSRTKCDGLFMANDYPLHLAKLDAISDGDRCWKVWASIETVKRLAVQLIQVDCWYSTHWNVHRSLRSEDVFIVPPCQDVLFTARTSQEWARKRPAFTAMDCPAISATSTPQIGLSDWACTTSARLMLHQLRLVESYSILERQAQLMDSHADLLPWSFFNNDTRSQSLVDGTIHMAHAANESAPDFEINAAVSWHANCLSLGCYMPMFEAAAGRSGPAAAKAALKDIGSWAHTPSARRCALHAARIYNLLLNRRFLDPIKLHSMVALFQAALVLGLYIFSMPEQENTESFNLIDEEIDWVALGAIGFSPGDNAGHEVDSASEAPVARFVLSGGRMCMADSTVTAGYVQARKCWLHCVHLMLSLGRWNTRIFSRILHVMADSLTDLETGTVDDTGQHLS